MVINILQVFIPAAFLHMDSDFASSFDSESLRDTGKKDEKEL